MRCRTRRRLRVRSHCLGQGTAAGRSAARGMHQLERAGVGRSDAASAAQARAVVSVILAALIDRWWGEPPGAVHPVVWMGRYLGWAGRILPALRAPFALTLGACCWLAG